MQIIHIFTVVPAAYKTEVQLMSYIWLKSLGCTDTLESVLRDGASPTGDGPPTHYICARKSTPAYLELYLKENTARAMKSYDWVHPGITDDKEIALTHFTTLLMEKEEALNFLGLKLCK